MDILKEILDALKTEERLMLATIVTTSGSTPAAALSKMLVKHGGILSVGTVGGGCMEGDVLLHAGRLYGANRAEILTFRLNEDDAEHGLICGGSLDVLIEPVTRNQEALIEEMRKIRDLGEDAVLMTRIDAGGGVVSKRLFRLQENVSSHQRGYSVAETGNGIPGAAPPSSGMIDLILKAHRRGETQRLKDAEGETLLEPLPGAPSLLIFGGGHVSKYVSRSASLAGFRVTVVDDREQYANPERFPEAVETRVLDFTSAFDQLEITPAHYLVIVTRGHKYDEELLGRACTTQAKYVGMIGSKRKVLTAFRHLSERGIPAQSLKRVHAPIGLDIGALTAEEIGISIVGELIAVRRGAGEAVRTKSEHLEELISPAGDGKESG